MKKVLIWVPLLGLLVLGYLYLRGMRMEFGVLKGETARVSRGDLTIPIDAAGKVIPDSRREIKAEASGEVEEVLVTAGDMVQEGDLLLRLRRDDEERNVYRAEQELLRSEISLARAKVTLDERKTSGIKSAESRLAGLKARLDYTRADYEHKQRLYEKEQEPPIEYYRAQASYLELLAQIESATADVTQAQKAVELAEKDVSLSEAAVESAKTTLGDARKRLEKTDIIAPVDGMVAEVFVEEGEVIQGGKTTITGGTVLASIADWSTCYVRAEVDEADVGEVIRIAPRSARPGHHRVASATTDAAADAPDKVPPIETGVPVEIHVEAFREDDFEGVIERIYPEPKSGSSIVTYLVDIRVTSENRPLLMSSMQADVRFTAKSVYEAVLVPHEAIKRGPDDELGVYLVAREPGGVESAPEFRRCKIGLDNGMYAQVLEGVKEGDEVFTKLPQKTEKEREEEDRRS